MCFCTYIYHEYGEQNDACVCIMSMYNNDTCIVRLLVNLRVVFEEVFSLKVMKVKEIALVYATNRETQLEHVFY